MNLTFGALNTMTPSPTGNNGSRGVSSNLPLPFSTPRQSARSVMKGGHHLTTWLPRKGGVISHSKRPCEKCAVLIVMCSFQETGFRNIASKTLKVAVVVIAKHHGVRGDLDGCYNASRYCHY